MLLLQAISGKQVFIANMQLFTPLVPETLISFTGGRDLRELAIEEIFHIFRQKNAIQVDIVECYKKKHGYFICNW